MYGQMRHRARAAVVAARAAASEGAVGAAGRPLAPPTRGTASSGRIGDALSSLLLTQHKRVVTQQLQAASRITSTPPSMLTGLDGAAHVGTTRGVAARGGASGGGGCGGVGGVNVGAAAARRYSSGPPRVVGVGGGPVGWMSLAMVVTTGGGLLYYYEMERARRMAGGCTS
jgi:hypothetical protein